MLKNTYDNLPYSIKLRIQLSISLLLFIVLFRFSPDFEKNTPNQRIFQPEEPLTLDIIEITTQSAPPASPPRPRVPVDVTRDPIISETEIDPLLEFDFTFEPLQLPVSGSGGIGNVVLNPQRPPRVQRIVEPVSPDQSVRAEITALLTINPDGRVADVEIQGIRIFNETIMQFETAASINPAFLEATEYAAMQWIFRPAVLNNEPVWSVSEHVFVFGKGIN